MTNKKYRIRRKVKSAKVKPAERKPAKRELAKAKRELAKAKRELAKAKRELAKAKAKPAKAKAKPAKAKAKPAKAKPAKAKPAKRKLAKAKPAKAKPAKRKLAKRKPAKVKPAKPEISSQLQQEVAGFVHFFDSFEHDSADGAVNRDGTADVDVHLSLSADLIELQERLERIVPLVSPQWWIRVGMIGTRIKGETYYGPTDTELEVHGFIKKFIAWRTIARYVGAFVAADGLYQKLFKFFNIDSILVELHWTEQSKPLR